MPDTLGGLSYSFALYCAFRAFNIIIYFYFALFMYSPMVMTSRAPKRFFLNSRSHEKRGETERERVELARRSATSPPRPLSKRGLPNRRVGSCRASRVAQARFPAEIEAPRCRGWCLYDWTPVECTATSRLRNQLGTSLLTDTLTFAVLRDPTMSIVEPSACTCSLTMLRPTCAPDPRA